MPKAEPDHQSFYERARPLLESLIADYPLAPVSLYRWAAEHRRLARSILADFPSPEAPHAD